MVKFALFTFRSVRVSVFQRVQSVFRERERGVLLWSESSYDASLRMKKRENEKLCRENERNVPHLLQVNNIFVARRLECIGIPPTFSSPTLFSSVVLVDDDSASIRSLLGCSDANEESSRVLLLFVLLVSLLLLLEKRRLGDDFPRRLLLFFRRRFFRRRRCICRRFPYERTIQTTTRRRRRRRRVCRSSSLEAVVVEVVRENARAVVRTGRHV